MANEENGTSEDNNAQGDLEGDAEGDLVIDCPRCGNSSHVRFYGPCQRCVAQLRDSYRAEARDVEAPEYEPKMNVTPNAVATKE